MYQYRITIDGSTGPVQSDYPGAQWSAATQVCEDRGLPATFERRLITDIDILPLLVDPAGYITIGSRVVCPWQTIAAMR